MTNNIFNTKKKLFEFIRGNVLPLGVSFCPLPKVVIFQNQLEDTANAKWSFKHKISSFLTKAVSMSTFAKTFGNLEMHIPLVSKLGTSMIH